MLPLKRLLEPLPKQKHGLLPKRRLLPRPKRKLPPRPKHGLPRKPRRLPARLKYGLLLRPKRRLLPKLLRGLPLKLLRGLPLRQELAQRLRLASRLSPRHPQCLCCKQHRVCRPLQRAVWPPHSHGPWPGLMAPSYCQRPTS